MPPTDNLAALLRQCHAIYQQRLEDGDWPWGHDNHMKYEKRHQQFDGQLPLILPEHPLSQQQND